MWPNKALTDNKIKKITKYTLNITIFIHVRVYQRLLIRQMLIKLLRKKSRPM